MDWWWIALIAGGLVVALAIAQRMRLIDLTGRHRSSGSFGGLMASLDAVFAPTKHEAAMECAREAVLPAPAPIPGDGDKGVFGGRVVIDLAETEGGGSPEVGTAQGTGEGVAP